MDAAIRPSAFIEEDTVTIADIHASMGGEADPTGDFAAGRTHFHATSEEFLACVDSQPYEHG